MSLLSFPHAEKRTRFLASIAALIFSVLTANLGHTGRILAMRLTAILLILAFIIPGFFISDTYKASAKNISIASAAPISAPPEPFGVEGGDAGRGECVSSSVGCGIGTRATAWVSAFFVTPPVTAPSFSENLPASFGSLLSFFVPASKSEASAEEAAPLPTTTADVDFDFDGDGKADLGRWQASTTEFKIKNSNGGSFSTHTIGTSTSKIVPGDFDGDGKTDAAVFAARYLDDKEQFERSYSNDLIWFDGRHSGGG